MSQADAITSDWRVELVLGDISIEDKEKLSAWMKYKKAVEAVDVATAPNVSWPVQPQE